MKATAKHNVNYNGTWYKYGETFNVADNDVDAMREHCNFVNEYVPFAEQMREQEQDAPRRGRPRKNKD